MIYIILSRPVISQQHFGGIYGVTSSNQVKGFTEGERIVEVSGSANIPPRYVCTYCWSYEWHALDSASVFLRRVGISKVPSGSNAVTFCLGRGGLLPLGMGGGVKQPNGVTGNCSCQCTRPTPEEVTWGSDELSLSGRRQQYGQHLNPTLVRQFWHLVCVYLLT